MLDFTRLRKNMKKDFSGLKPLKIAILSDSASQILAVALKGHGYERGFSFEIFEANYSNVQTEVMQTASAFYTFNPDVVLLAYSVQKLGPEFYQLHQESRDNFAENKASELAGLVAKMQERLNAKVILFNIAEKDDKVFGNFANKLPRSFLYQIRKLNLKIMEMAHANPSVFVCDLQNLVMELGWERSFDVSHYIVSDLVWSLNLLPALAKQVSSIIEATEGRLKKCIVLDLDNTLWGGIIGDDGLRGIEIGNLGNGKAFTALQYWVKELKDRGIIVCVCSKNTESIAKEPFEQHPDMVLRLQDIAVFVANWENKVDNLNQIQQTLNIGFDAMVFVDDNPFERGMVKEAIPALEVPDLPENPLNFLAHLQSLNLFETATITQDDGRRVQQYQQETLRVSSKYNYKNELEYLESLNMLAQIFPLDSFTVPRAAQLSQRSNQFNLRTIRYSESDLERMAASKSHHAFLVKLSDKFGDYGLISFVVLKKDNGRLFIESWMMSCRVLKRQVEIFVLNEIVRIAKATGIDTIVGEYLPTEKNALVKDHYSQLGFVPCGAHFCLTVSDYHERAVPLEYSSTQNLSQTV